METKNTSIGEYCNRLSMKEPIPGGGSVNGVYGSIASSLAIMVLEYSISNKKCVQFKKELSKSKTFFKSAARKFTKLSDRDMAAYGAYSKGGGKKKQAIKRMTKVPFEMMALAIESLELLVDLDGKTNRYLDTDLVIAVESFKLVFNTSLRNVEGNLTFCEDKDFVKEIKKQLMKLKRRFARVAMWQI